MGVAESVSTISCLAVRVALGGGLTISHAECSADLEFRIDGFDGTEGLALGDIDDVGSAHAFGEILARGRVNAPGITEESEDPGLVENAPMGDAVAEGTDGQVSIVGEARGEITIGPAAGFLQFLREVPVVERCEGTNFGFQERIGEALVVIEAF